MIARLYYANCVLCEAVSFLNSSTYAGFNLFLFAFFCSIVAVDHCAIVSSTAGKDITLNI